MLRRKKETVLDLSEGKKRNMKIKEVCLYVTCRCVSRYIIRREHGGTCTPLDSHSRVVK